MRLTNHALSCCALYLIKQEVTNVPWESALKCRTLTHPGPTHLTPMVVCVCELSIGKTMHRHDQQRATQAHPLVGVVHLLRLAPHPHPGLGLISDPSEDMLLNLSKAKHTHNIWKAVNFWFVLSPLSLSHLNALSLLMSSPLLLFLCRQVCFHLVFSPLRKGDLSRFVFIFYSFPIWFCVSFSFFLLLDSLLSSEWREARDCGCFLSLALRPGSCCLRLLVAIL